MIDAIEQTTELPITEKLKTLKGLQEQCVLLGETYQIDYHVNSDRWSVSTAGAEYVQPVNYPAAVATLVANVKRLNRNKEEAASINEAEVDRLGNVYMDFVKNHRSKTDEKLERYWLMTDQHSFNRLPSYMSNLEMYLDVIKYHCCVEGLSHWSVSIGSETFHHRTNLLWTEIEAQLRMLVAKRIQEFPYEILYMFKVNGTDSFITEIKCYQAPGSPDLPKDAIYHWLRIDGVRVEPLEFVERVLVEADNKVDTRYFVGYKLNVTDKGAVLNIPHASSISYDPYMSPNFIKTGVRARIKEYLSTLPFLPINHDNKDD